MTEKRKPTFDLDAFKVLFRNAGRLQATGTAVRTAAALRFDRAEIVAAIQTMDRSRFYKSMTAYANNRVWRDVYHVPWAGGTLYVEFTASNGNDFLSLSFKERDDD